LSNVPGLINEFPHNLNIIREYYKNPTPTYAQSHDAIEGVSLYNSEDMKKFFDNLEGHGFRWAIPLSQYRRDFYEKIKKKIFTDFCTAL
jgi:hypothetical protein